ncbi:hypothetical protein LOC68_15880 [Blastopirellula sp. JC732]|uniref:Uncharacterized protein n=1 Tax=Blastopirellula sediminis TaxID=2894196 RepID=A0A9X1MPA4_9BACT|nr:hypothetical protein [Blastopirellula sediminis]MCC9606834.1 hypothetical protein [Blastopirellula sediminis]MCC9629870.1 hypothetical protein [Blastopirellula sediminis]
MTGKEASQAASLCDLSEDAQKLLAKEPDSARFFKALVDGEMHDDALLFAAACLAPMDRIWWGVMCVWESLRPDVNDDDDLLLQMLVGYLREPNEDLRWKCRTMAKRKEVSPQLKMLAHALFHSGESVTPAGGPKLKPSPKVPVALIATAIKSAATACGQKKKVGMKPEFLRLAMEVSRGQHNWATAAAAT